NEIKDLLDELEKGRHGIRNRTIAIVMLNTGLRISELCSLNIQDVDFNNNKIYILGKGSKERIVFLNNSCIDAIKEYLIFRSSSVDALFQSQFNKRITPRTIQIFIKKAVEKLCIEKNITPHALRHTCATYMLKNKIDLRTIQKVLGHSNISTTQIYTFVEDEQLENAFFSLEKFF
ncbi:tyrosine-type recombinase/integrase, partial [Clostridium cylindrosporum]